MHSKSRNSAELLIRSNGPLISVVDDDDIVCEALQELIVSLGYNATGFLSAEEFLTSGIVLDTACLVSDMQMPGMTGLDLQARLIADGRHIPIIFVTAFADEKTRTRALEGGAIGLLIKPVDPDDLAHCLKRALAEEEKGVKTLQYPSEALRKKLVIAGIPESEHSRDSLAAKMPDFRVRALEAISVDMLAELLLYLIAKGFVTLPIASDKALLDMPWGSHVCQFYDGKEDLVKMLVPYFKQGLERNEACVWLVGDLTVEEARNALAAVVPDLTRFMDTGQMQILHYTEFYTNANGTVKPPAQLSDAFAAMGLTVRANGFEGLRASGSVSWVNDAESMSQFMDYETKVNLAIQNSRIMAVCTYPAQAAAMCQCRELIHNHGKIFVKRGEWVHDKSKDAEKIEAVFASLAAQSQAANVGA